MKVRPVFYEPVSITLLLGIKLHPIIYTDVYSIVYTTDYKSDKTIK